MTLFNAFLNESLVKKVTNFWRILPKRQRVQLFPIFFLTLIGAFLEMLGIGLIIPLIGIISSPNFLNENKFLLELLPFLSISSEEEFLMYFLSLLLIFFIFKSFFLGINNWILAHYVFRIKALIGNLLFKRYLLMPNLDRLDYNSSTLIRNTTIETNLLVSQAIFPLFILITESLVFLTVSILLLSYSFIHTIFAALTIFITMFIFQILVKRHIESWSKLRIYNDGIKLKAIQEGIAVSREISILGRQSFFLNRFSNANFNTSNVERNYFAINQLPRIWLEAVGISLLVVIILISIKINSLNGDTISTLALFAAASFKLLPSSNRILASLQSLKFGKKVLDDLMLELINDNSPENLDLKTIRFKKNIVLKDLSFSYPDIKQETIRSVNIVINKNDSVGIIGQSGSGKSTLVNILLGLLTPTGGTILVDGINIQDDIRSWQNQIGYVPQDIYLVDDTLKNNIALGINQDEIDELALQSCIEVSNVNQFIDSLSDGLDTILGERGDKLSGGQKQRIGIARALYHNPEIIIFDEATSALDNTTEANILDSLKKIRNDKTLIIISHKPTTIEHCNKIFQIRNGKIELVDS